MSQTKKRTSSITLSQIVPLLRSSGLVLDASPSTESLSIPLRLVTDSRKIKAGDTFLAYKGVSGNGHEHINKAVTLGASLIILEDPAFIATAAPVAWLLVKSGRAAWSHLAAAAHGHPEKQLNILGVTGTNGKTSTVWMIAELLRLAEVPCLTIGTLGAYLNGEKLETTHTTPDPDMLYAFLAKAVEQGIKTVAMEVSSHAIVQEKLLPIRFTACAFTSFSRDHLDFHSSMETYWQAKWRLFSELAKPHARFVFASNLPHLDSLQGFSQESWVYGLSAKESYRKYHAQNFLDLSIRKMSFAGSMLDLNSGHHSYSAEVPYFSRHAIENFAAALLLTEKVQPNSINPPLWKNLRPVPGRLETITHDSQPTVVVDYAHTPDALQKTLEVLRPLCQGRLKVVFGCGGNRDKGKRPMMASVAENLADDIYITSDNPRHEDPIAIINDIAAGLKNHKRAIIEADRAHAIATAISNSAPNDTILIAGKGHEAYQIIGDKVLDFDDCQIAKQLLMQGETL